MTQHKTSAHNIVPAGEYSVTPICLVTPKRVCLYWLSACLLWLLIGCNQQNLVAHKIGCLLYCGCHIYHITFSYIIFNYIIFELSCTQQSISSFFKCDIACNGRHFYTSFILLMESVIFYISVTTVTVSVSSLVV